MRSFIRKLVIFRIAASSTFALTLACLAGCGEEPTQVSRVHQAEAPAYEGKADGSVDRPDMGCGVVLRSVHRLPNGTGGYRTRCADGQCRYLWFGQLDVDATKIAGLTGVEVLFRTGATGEQWYSTAAWPTDGAEGAFARWAFVIDEYTPAEGMSMTSLNRTVIELIPYALTGEGRLFDHNRVADPFGAYRLELSNGWSVGPDAACGPLSDAGAWVFSYPDFAEVQVGRAVVAGGQVRLVYDGRRLRETQACLGGHGAVSATTLVATWMFDGDQGRGGSAEVESWIESYGYACNDEGGPCITDRTHQPVIDVPADARQLEVWFGCVPMGQGSPSGWDSNFGANYGLAIPAAPVEELWAGSFQAKLSRETSDPCEGGTPLGDQAFDFGTWARQRAALTNVCFEVYKQGVTDHDNPDLWQQLDVQVHYTYGDDQLHQLYAEVVGRAGNNARYAFDLRGLDPFRAYHCPEGPVEEVSVGGEPYLQSGFGFFVTVNGVEIRPAGPDSLFEGSFTDYATNPWRDENCQ